MEYELTFNPPIDAWDTLSIIAVRTNERSGFDVPLKAEFLEVKFCVELVKPKDTEDKRVEYALTFNPPVNAWDMLDVANARADELEKTRESANVNLKPKFSAVKFSMPEPALPQKPDKISYENPFQIAIREIAVKNPAVAGDYVGEDGLVHCGKCHAPKQCVKTMFGEDLKLPIGCECTKKRQGGT